MILLSAGLLIVYVLRSPNMCMKQEKYDKERINIKIADNMRSDRYGRNNRNTGNGLGLRSMVDVSPAPAE